MPPENQSKLSTRRHLPHDIPLSVDPGTSLFFITVNCRQRHSNQLCNVKTASVIYEATSHYAAIGKWYPHLLLLMPDHLHMITIFELRENRMRRIVESWKGWLRKHIGIEWQRGFFDHRLRDCKEIREKKDYVLNNPVRAGLIDDEDAWPWKKTPPW